MKKNAHTLSYFIPLILVSVFLLISWERSQSQTISAPSETLPRINLPSLTQPSTRFSSRSFQGKVCLLNFWASWCGACKAEHTTLMAIKREYPIPIYGIDFKDDTDSARAWLRNHGNPYTAVGADENGDLSLPLDIDGIPETFLLDKNGVIRYRFKGSLNINSWNNTMLPLVKQLMDE